MNESAADNGETEAYINRYPTPSIIQPDCNVIVKIEGNAFNGI